MYSAWIFFNRIADLHDGIQRQLSSVTDPSIFRVRSTPRQRFTSLTPPQHVAVFNDDDFYKWLMDSDHDADDRIPQSRLESYRAALAWEGEDEEDEMYDDEVHEDYENEDRPEPKQPSPEELAEQQRQQETYPEELVAQHQPQGKFVGGNNNNNP